VYGPSSVSPAAVGRLVEYRLVAPEALAGSVLTEWRNTGDAQRRSAGEADLLAAAEAGGDLDPAVGDEPGLDGDDVVGTAGPSDPHGG
jgi:hypothetical protein